MGVGKIFIEEGGWQGVIAPLAALAEPGLPLSAAELTWLSTARPQEARFRESRAALLLAKTLVNDEVVHEASGKPRYRCAPLNLSLSHKDDWVAAIVAPAPARVGVDLECLGALRHAPAFLRHALTAEERAQLADFSAAWRLNEEGAALALWGLKESFFKAGGTTSLPQEVRFALASKGPALTCQQWRQESWHPVPIEASFVGTQGPLLITALRLPGATPA